MAPRRASLPHTRARHGQRPVVLRHEQGEGGSVRPRSHVDDGLPGEVDIDIRCGEQDVADLRRHPTVADRHLAQGLERKRIAHGMRQDRDLADRRITRDRLQQALQGIAGIGRALAVVAVGQHAAARGPGEQDRHHGGVGVVHDLREAEDRIVEAVVEAVDEDQHLAFRRGPQGAMEPGERLRAVDHVGLERHELRGRIARYLLRPLHLADLPGVRRRDRDRDVGEGRRWSPVAREHLRRLGTLAGGGDQHVDPARAGNGPAHRNHHAPDTGAGAETGHQGQDQGKARDLRPDSPSRF